MVSEPHPHPKKSTFVDAIKVFLRSQLSAFLGGICDYSMMILLTQYGHIFYAFSIVISGSCGAVINFSINRYWTFRITNVSAARQLQKFVFVVMGSIALKSSGTYLLTELLKLDYRISRLCVDAVVALAFNFTLQRYWVFKVKKDLAELSAEDDNENKE